MPESCASDLQITGTHADPAKKVYHAAGGSNPSRQASQMIVLFGLSFPGPPHHSQFVKLTTQSPGYSQSKTAFGVSLFRHIHVTALTIHPAGPSVAQPTVHAALPIPISSVQARDLIDSSEKLTG